jgi:hypothetical protein
MAYVVDPNEEEQEQPAQPVAAATSTPVAQPAPQPQQATRYVNFDRIFAANKDRAAKQAQALGNKIQNQGQQLRDQVTQANTTLQRKTTQATPGDHRGEDAYTYAGPKTLDEAGVNTGAISTGIGHLGQQLAASQSVAGIQALMGGGAPVSAMDAALIRGASGTLFRGLRDQYKDLGTQWASEQERAQGIVGEAQKKTEDLEAQRKKYWLDQNQTTLTKHYNDEFQRRIGTDIIPEWRRKLIWDSIVHPEKYRGADPYGVLSTTNYKHKARAPTKTPVAAPSLAAPQSIQSQEDAEFERAFGKRRPR